MKTIINEKFIKYFNKGCIILLITILIHAIISLVFNKYFSNTLITFEALLTSIICVCLIITNDKIPSYGMTICLLLYTICTQFGAAIVYYLFRSWYSPILLKHSAFLKSDFFAKSILIGCIAVICYIVGVYIATNIKKIEIKSKALTSNKTQDNKDYTKKIILYSGYVLLSIILVFFITLFITGKISFSMSYEEYINNVSMKLGRVYAILLFLYAVGICFVMAIGNKKEMIIGIILFGISAVILLVTGNRGEILYPLLACLGVLGYRGFKLKWKLVVVLCLILFIIIPFVRIYRDNKSNIGQIKDIKIFETLADPFVEMGMQLRLSTYIVEEIDSGDREFLYGFSYWYSLIKPIGYVFNIDKVIDIPEDYNFEKRFPTMAFSQVAESYANFGVVGVVVFFIILGLVMGIFEKSKLTSLPLVFIVCFSEIMINATRNYFSMVPTMIYMVLIIITGIVLLNKLINKCFIKNRRKSEGK